MLVTWSIPFPLLAGATKEIWSGFSLHRLSLLQFVATGVGARRGRSAAKTNANTANRETTAASSQSEQSDGNSDNNAEKARQRLIEKQEKQWLQDGQNIVAG